MRIHYFQHVPFENPASILSWATARKAALSSTHWFDNNPQMPSLDAFDHLVVMGGPMGVYD